MSRKDRETIQIQLDCIRNNQKFIHEVILGKAAKLEQANECIESQLRLKQAVLEQITEERDALRKENKSLEQERDALELRLRHLLRSETVRLFDELNEKGRHRRDIGKLDTYGVHNKIKEQELAAICPRRILDTEALAAPGGKMITFPDDNVNVKDMANGVDIRVGHNYVDVIYPDGKKVRFCPSEHKGVTP